MSISLRSLAGKNVVNGNTSPLLGSQLMKNRDANSVSCKDLAFQICFVIIETNLNS